MAETKNMKKEHWQCLRKRPMTEGGAKKRASRIGAEIGGNAMNAYSCPFCKAWHVGHIPKKQLKHYKQN